jgi:hypothetical protein
VSPGLGSVPDDSICLFTSGIVVIPIEPPGHSFHVSSSDDNGIDVLLLDDDSPGLGSAPIVIGIDDDDGVDATWSEPPGLSSIPDEPIVIDTRSEPPGLGLIPSEPRLSTLIVLDIHDDDGIFEIPSEPPILSSASIVMDINDDDGVDAIWNKPPGLSSIPDESIVVDTGASLAWTRLDSE